MRRLFTIASAVSMLLLLAVLIVWAFAQRMYVPAWLFTVRNFAIWIDPKAVSIGTPDEIGPSLSYVWIIIALAVLPLAWAQVLFIREQAEKRAIAQGKCRQCGYDLRASTERCPECGTVVPQKTTA